MKYYYFLFLLFIPFCLIGQRFQHSFGLAGIMEAQRTQIFDYTPQDRPTYQVRTNPYADANYYPSLTYKPRLSLFKFSERNMGIGLSAPININGYFEISTNNAPSASSSPQNYVFLHIPLFLNFNYGSNAFRDATPKKNFGFFAGAGAAFTYNARERGRSSGFFSPNVNLGLRTSSGNTRVELTYNFTLFPPVHGKFSPLYEDWYYDNELEMRVVERVFIQYYQFSPTARQIHAISLTFYPKKRKKKTEDVLD